MALGRSDQHSSVVFVADAVLGRERNLQREAVQSQKARLEVYATKLELDPGT